MLRGMTIWGTFLFKVISVLTLGLELTTPRARVAPSAAIPARGPSFGDFLGFDAEGSFLLPWYCLSLPRWRGGLGGAGERSHAALEGPRLVSLLSSFLPSLLQDQTCPVLSLGCECPSYLLSLR